MTGDKPLYESAKVMFTDIHVDFTPLLFYLLETVHHGEHKGL